MHYISFIVLCTIMYYHASCEALSEIKCFNVSNGGAIFPLFVTVSARGGIFYHRYHNIIKNISLTMYCYKSVKGNGDIA